MACYHPIDCWRVVDPTAKSGHRIVFGHPEGLRGAEPISIPCGKCIGCRLAKSRQWAVRCVHEASLHDRNCFITLTFNDANLPEDMSVHVRDLQLFFKRLRRSLSYEHTKIRFFACGEYGSEFARPHYHAIIFGYDFSDDRVLLRNTPYGPLYISERLSRLWPYGFNTIGNVTFNTCAYVARYVTKKVYGPTAAEHYGDRHPEFIVMSRKPGIAYDWIKKHYHDVYDYDKVVLKDGMITRPPKYYDRFLDGLDESWYNQIVEKRKSEIVPESQGRLLVKEEVQKLKADRLIRPLERGD